MEKEIDHLKTIIAVLMTKHAAILSCTTVKEARQLAGSALYMANKIEEMKTHEQA